MYIERIRRALFPFWGVGILRGENNSYENRDLIVLLYAHYISFNSSLNIHSNYSNDKKLKVGSVYKLVYIDITCT